MLRCLFPLVLALLPLLSARADDWKPIERRLPPAGIELKQADRQKIEQGLKQLQERIDAYRKAGQVDEDGLVDVDVYRKAVEFALRHNEFYKPQDAQKALDALKTAQERLQALEQGQKPWAEQTGLVVRGYRSRIDGSVQPYGLVIPEKLDLQSPVPLYIWLHGRGDQQTDLHFIQERASKPGQIQPEGAIVLHPFGRHCIGWKSAGEIDVLEAIESVASRYAIDPDRLVLMGFSMGGAGAWHIGAHYADRWAAVHAGAGFVDVKRYQNLRPENYPPAYEQVLWGVYDVPDYVRNLFNLPVVAYSGEVDKQKDAADYMAETFAAHERTLPHLIGPGMGHKYHPEVLPQVMEQMRQAAAKGRAKFPQEVHLQTKTLRYNRMHWIELLGLGQHWQDARVDAQTRGDQAILTTKNVTALRLEVPPGVKSLSIDGQQVPVEGSTMTLERQDGRWTPVTEIAAEGLRKRPGLQGPIDDAFLEPFLVVVPTGKAAHPQVNRWVEFELQHFLDRWRAVYRGEPRVKRDIDVTEEDRQKYHLVLWGDPQSNQVLGRIAGKLPISWNAQQVQVGDRNFAADAHVPLLIYPNPENPEKYVVINSGPTHREAHDRTNSLQNPKLPDWAVVQADVAPSAEAPGRVVAADFFDERWQLRRADDQPAASPAAK